MMIVEPIAHTVFPEDYPLVDGTQKPRMKQEARGQETDLDRLAEFAGRTCYLSYDKPNPKTAHNHFYLANILAQGHESVLEHASVTFYVAGVSRALLAELTRHRHLSFSVVSQRYVDAGELETVYPPIIDDLPSHLQVQVGDLIDKAREESDNCYTLLFELLKSHGYKHKEAREAARAVLPSAVESPMVVTGNVRAWRDVLKKRHHVAADKELQKFAKEVLGHLRCLAPSSVQDIPDEPYGSEKA